MDNAEFQSQLAEMIADSVQAAADVVNSKASLQKAITALEVNKGNIAVGEVKLQKAVADYNRNKKLIADQAITQKQMDDSKYNFESAEKLLENNKNDFDAAKSKIPVLESVINKSVALISVQIKNESKILRVKSKLVTNHYKSQTADIKMEWPLILMWLILLLICKKQVYFNFNMSINFAWQKLN